MNPPSPVALPLAAALLAAVLATPPLAAVDFTVDSTADAVDAVPGDGVCATGANECTLRAAVMEANALAGADTVTLPVGSFALTIADTGAVTDAEGDLDIDDDLTITGAGVADTTIDASALIRMFVVGDAVSLTVEELTLQPGQPPAPGTPNARLADTGAGSALRLDTVEILPYIGSVAISSALVHHTGDALTFDGVDVTLSRTQAVVEVEPAGAGPVTVDLLNSTLQFAAGGQEPSFLLLDTTVQATVTVDHVTVDGGGLGGTPILWLRPQGTAALIVGITDSVFRQIGLGTTVLNVDAADSTIVQLDMLRTTMEDVDNAFSLSVDPTASESFDLEESLIHSTGYVQTFWSDTSVRNTTIIAFFIEMFDAHFSNATLVTDNLRSDSRPVIMRNSILLGSCYGSAVIESRGHNVFSDTSSCGFFGDFTGDQYDVDPELDILADNGGPTKTRAPLAGSPALDAGSPATPGSGDPACEAADQRGVARPQDGTGDLTARCDSGAFESMGVPDPIFDYGDAPAPYPTTDADDGARHRGGSLFLGSGVSTEDDGQPSLLADADDDDGVLFLGPFVPGATTQVEVTVSEAATLEMWWDFDQDGVWDDPWEQQPAEQVIAAGTTQFGIDVPEDAPVGDTYVRARVSSVLTNPTGEAPDGEVEDSLLSVDEPPFVRAYVGPNRDVALGGTLRLGVSPPADGGVPPYTFSWTIDPGAGASLDDPNRYDPQVTASLEGDYQACMTASDSASGEDVECLGIYVFCPDTVNQDPVDTWDDELVDYWAQLVVASSDYVVRSGGRVGFRAGQSIALGNGFRVEAGASFVAAIDPAVETGCGESLRVVRGR